MVHLSSVSNRRTHAQRDESGGTDSSAQSSAGSESGSSTTQAASEVAKGTLLSLVDGEGGAIRKIFSYLNISEACRLVAGTSKALRNPNFREEIPYTFAPPLELIPELMPDPQNPTVKPAAWNRVIPGFTRFRAPEGTTDAQLGALIDSGWLNSATHVEFQYRLPPGTTDAQLRALIDSGRFNAVTHWDLQGCNRLTDAGLAHLALLPSLEHLNVAGCNQFTDTGLAHIANLTGLKSLNLLGCNRITTQGITLLAQLPNLDRLVSAIRIPDFLNDAQIGVLVNSGRFNRVTHWDLGDCNRLTDASLAHLARVPGLEHLNAAGCNFTDAGLAHIANLTGLKSLNLLRCPRITNQGLLTLLAQLPNLERVLFPIRVPAFIADARLGALIDSGRFNRATHWDLRGCDQLTDAGLAHMVRLPSLEHLDIRGCNLITNAILSRLRASHPNLVVLR